MSKRRSQKFQFTKLGKVLSWLVGFFSRLIPAVLILGFVFLIYTGIQGVLYKDPYFQVGKVTVFPSGILNEAEYQYLENETRGKSLLVINLRKISQNLMRNTQIKKAEVQRQFPNILKIFLVTRNPLFQVQLRKGGGYYLIGGDQVVLSENRIPKPDFIVVEDYGSGKKSYVTGSLYQNKYFNRIAEMLDWVKVDPIWSREVIAKISVDPLGNFIFVLNDGIELRLGKNPLVAEGKRSALEKLLKSNERAELLYLDLRYQDIIVRKRV